MFLLPLALLQVVLSANISDSMMLAVVPSQAQESQVAVSGDSTGKLDAASPELLGLFRAISGRWAIDMKFEPSPEMPNGAQGKGEEVWKPLAGGLVLSDEEDLELPQGKVHLLGVIWWDRASKEFRGMECINQDP